MKPFFTVTVDGKPPVLEITIEGLELGLGGNDRGHWRERNKATRRVRKAVSNALFIALGVGPDQVDRVLSLPAVVSMTRVSPGNTPMDDDNLGGALKPVRDEVAAYIGPAFKAKNDRDPRWTWKPLQARGEWSVRVRIEAKPPAGPKRNEIVRKR